MRRFEKFRACCLFCPHCEDYKFDSKIGVWLKAEKIHLIKLIVGG